MIEKFIQDDVQTPVVLVVLALAFAMTVKVEPMVPRQHNTAAHTTKNHPVANNTLFDGKVTTEP